MRPSRRSVLTWGAASVGTGLLAPGRAAAAGSCTASAALAAMSLEQRVGQLFMVGAPAGSADSTLLAQLDSLQLGSVMLTGRSTAGVDAVAKVTAAYRQREAGAGGPGLLVATDQEGGAVQVLSGTGFSTIPAALTQSGWSAARVRSSAATWGRQLRAAGVNLNLGPVLDTVPSADWENPPIGDFRRNYGYGAQSVSEKGVAALRGMRDAKVACAVKHFPGLGLVHANTDTTADVHDPTTTRTAGTRAPFAAAVGVGTELVMVSSAIYDRIDERNPAIFSSSVIGRMLRDDLAYDGVVISDDLGKATAMSPYPVKERAARLLLAGGDLVLSVEAGVAPAMHAGLLEQARSNAGVAERVAESALRVLRLKERLGLLGAC